MKTAAELLDAHFREMRADFAAWCALYADDAVIEYPYGAYANVVSPLTGIAAMSKSVRGFFGCGSGLSRQRLEGQPRIDEAYACVAAAEVVRMMRLYPIE